MKKGLDERQEQIMAKTGAASFYVMFFVCAAAIVIELIVKGSLENVIGETVCFLAGGITCLIGNIKNGIWAKTGRNVTIGQNLLGSVICSGIFSIFYAFVIGRMAAENVNISKYVGMFFIGITIVCFLCLYILGKISQAKKEQQEKKYSE